MYPFNAQGNFEIFIRDTTDFTYLLRCVLLGTEFIRVRMRRAFTCLILVIFGVKGFPLFWFQIVPVAGLC